MGKIVYFVHTSVDGYVEGPNGEFDWAAMAPELSAYSNELNDRVEVFGYGRVVWEMMSGFWPRAESISDDPHDLHFAPIWREKRKVVFSRTLSGLGWNARVISGDLAAEVKKLKRESGDILLTGGSALPGALTALGLIDEYHVVVHPVVLGGGKPLFRPENGRMDLRLAESRTLDGRTVLLRYAPATKS